MYLKKNVSLKTGRTRISIDHGFRDSTENPSRKHYRLKVRVSVLCCTFPVFFLSYSNMGIHVYGVGIFHCRVGLLILFVQR